ncbi:MAG: hypothetical protein GY862_31010 [Gammaproteobacteria bacterium]|nr:hypothetical protein [Gammaproteobacteria bacterium]
MSTIISNGELLRRAVRWLSEEKTHNYKAIEEASMRFNLSPRDEEFLVRNFLKRRRNDVMLIT